MATEPTSANPPQGTSFAETALVLGGKSADEARRTGAIDSADDQVEALFAPQYQTVNSPVHRAVWDRGVPVELFASTPPVDAAGRAEGDGRLDRRGEEARRGAHAAQRRRARSPSRCSPNLGAAGYWGLLVDKEYGGSGAPFSSFAPFLTRMALVEPTVAGLASVHGCIGAVDPVRTFGNAEQKQRFLPGLASGSRLERVRAHRAVCRQRPHGAAHDGAARRRRLRRQRRKAVHHECRARPDDWPGVPDRRQAGRADRRIAAGRERELPAPQVRPVGAQANVQSRHHLPRLPRAGREPARSRRAATASRSPTTASTWAAFRSVRTPPARCG